MTQADLATHEKLDLHEYLAFKNVCATKALTMSKLVSDRHLKALLEDTFETDRRHIQEISDLLSITLH